MLFKKLTFCNIFRESLNDIRSFAIILVRMETNEPNISMG